METGAGFQEQFAPMLRANYVGLPRQETSLAVACSRKRLNFGGVAANTRRLFESGSSGSRPEALITEGAAGPLENGEGQEACAAYKKEKKQGAGQGRKDGFPERGGDKVRWGGQTLNGLNRRAG